MIPIHMSLLQHCTKLTQLHHVGVKFTPEQATKAQTGGVEVYLYSFHNLGTRWGCVADATPQPFYSPGKDPVPIV